MSVWLNFDYMSVGPKIDEKEIDLLMRKTNGLSRQDAEILVKVGAELRRQYKTGDLPYGPSIGDLLNWAMLISDGTALLDAAEETIISLTSDDGEIQDIVRKIVRKTAGI